MIAALALDLDRSVMDSTHFRPNVIYLLLRGLIFDIKRVVVLAHTTSRQKPRRHVERFIYSECISQLWKADGSYMKSRLWVVYSHVLFGR